MAILSIDPSAVTLYAPEYSKNRVNPDPCVVGIKAVPYSKVQYYTRLISARTAGIVEQEKVMEITQGVQREQFVEHVVSVSNYFVGDKEVTDPGEFYDTADTDLIIEIIRAMESHSRLTEGQKKN